MNVQAATILLLAVSSAVALGARVLKLPYTVALVLAGLALGVTKVLPAPYLTRDLLYTVFLPGLIFEAAFHLSFEDGDASIERFRVSVRELFLSKDLAMARNYLRYLIERIVLTDNQVQVYAKPEAALRLMAAGQKNTEVKTPGGVLTSVMEWLPDVDSNHGHGD